LNCFAAFLKENEHVRKFKGLGRDRFCRKWILSLSEVLQPEAWDSLIQIKEKYQ